MIILSIFPKPCSKFIKINFHGSKLFYLSNSTLKAQVGAEKAIREAKEGLRFFDFVPRICSSSPVHRIETKI